MLPEQAIEISKVHFDHAKECLRDAKLLLAGESYRSAANRAYYAIFHAMRAVLALDSVDMKHHSGIISEFRKRYIKTGVRPKEVKNRKSAKFSLAISRKLAYSNFQTHIHSSGRNFT